MTKNSKRTNFYIHRLIAEHFIPNPENYLEINHIDHDKQNNKIENLEWCTRKENMQAMADFYRDTYTREKFYCMDCKKEIQKTSKRCVSCMGLNYRKVERPTKEELYELIKKKTFVEIGKMYGVNDNTIKKWCKNYGLPHRRKDLK